MSRVLDEGTLIGRDFKVVRPLASGNMGSVYIAEQLSTGKQRAVKVMSPELAANDKARERFVLEARVGAKIESDHVVEVVTAGIDDDTGMPYLVMELLKGEELGDRLKREGKLPLGEVVEILKQAGHALEAAHKLGIVHRDIKPENLFLVQARREGVPFTVKILDFGIAKLVAERTHEGTQAIGTPLFMAPEQTERGGKVTPAADVWPLGLLAYYMLTGELYWETWRDGITALLREVVLEPIAPPSARAKAQGVGELPAGFDEWFSRCVTRDLAVRFPEAGAAARAFVAMAKSGKGVEPAATAATIPADEVIEAALTGTGKTQGVKQSSAQTNMEASASLIEPAAKPPSRAGLAIGAVALIALGGGIYFWKAQSGSSSASTVPSAGATTATASAPATASASSATTAAASGQCPPGMIHIAGGKMIMGSTDDDLKDDVRPAHQVTLAGYCLDRTEVTVEAYEACSKRSDCVRAPTTVKFEGLEERDKKAYSELCNAGRAERAKHPINCIPWNLADAYCKVRGARLPTEAEWEFAARGTGQRTYPWGDDTPGPKRLNACDAQCLAWGKTNGIKLPPPMFDGDDGFSGTSPVGTFPDGASSAGVLDLAGNVWEWTADWYGAYNNEAQANPKGPDKGERRVVRGGGFNGLRPAWAKPAFRYSADPNEQSHGYGFRCAADAK
jgi:formylglycine-generating enzyme required for sulfatase activity/tRNA A-37 threonylcarbamoyl transferase component Bud32